MASSFYCPHCNQSYEFTPQVAGKKFRCVRCSEVFQTPTAEQIAESPSPLSRKSPEARLQRQSVTSIWDEAMKGPAAASSNTASSNTAPSTGPLEPINAYRPATESERTLTTFGIAIAAIALVCLLILFPILQVDNTVAVVLVMLLGLTGAGLIGAGLRAQWPLAWGVAGGVVLLLLLGLILSMRFGSGQASVAQGPTVAPASAPMPGQSGAVPTPSAQPPSPSPSPTPTTAGPSGGVTLPAVAVPPGTAVSPATPTSPATPPTVPVAPTSPSSPTPQPAMSQPSTSNTPANVGPTPPGTSASPPSGMPSPAAASPATASPATPSPATPSPGMPSPAALQPAPLQPAAPGTSATDAAALPPVVSAALRSTVLVEHTLGSGSGFAVAKDVVATNAHVVEGAFPDEIKVKYGRENQPAQRISRVVYIDRARDLCLLQGEMDIKELSVRSDYELKAGDPVVLMGNPSVRGGILMRNVTNRGKMRTLVHIEGQDLYHIDAEVNPGWSGGPVLDMEGQVVAIVVMKANDSATAEIRANMRKMDEDFREASPSSLEGGITYGIPASSLARVLGDGTLKDRKRQTVAHEQYVAQTVVSRMSALASLAMLNMQANVPVQVRAEASSLSQSGEPAKPNRFAKLKIDYVQLLPEETCRALTAFLKSRKIRELEDHFRKNLDARLDSVIESEHVSSEVKRDLKTLTKKLKDAAAYADRPANSYAAYSVKVNGFSRELKELVDRLEKGVENSEP